jgi:hypothetical protein
VKTTAAIFNYTRLLEERLEDLEREMHNSHLMSEISVQFDVFSFILT